MAERGGGYNLFFIKSSGYGLIYLNSLAIDALGVGRPMPYFLAEDYDAGLCY